MFTAVGYKPDRRKQVTNLHHGAVAQIWTLPQVAVPLDSRDRRRAAVLLAHRNISKIRIDNYYISNKIYETCHKREQRMVRGLPKPSPGEMELLSLLWQYGAMTLAEVHESMDQPVAYTTAQTRLNRLVEKGLAAKSKVGRMPTRYEASVEPDEIGASQLDSLVERVAQGSVVPLVAHLLDGAELSAGELKNLKQLVRQAEQRFKGRKDQQ